MKRFKIFAGLAILLFVILIVPTNAVLTAKDFYLRSAKPVIALLYSGSHWAVNVAKANHLSRENIELRKENSQLKKRYFEERELFLENKRLRRMLDFRQRKSVELDNAIACEIIGRDPSGWKNIVLIDKGGAAGIKKDMPVITEGGLVGKVSEVSAHVSKIKLITHPRFRVGAIIQKSRHTGVVFGTIEGEARMKYIALDADVQPGDIIETAGFSREYPKGIIIGEVDSAWKEPGQLYKVVSIKLSADIDRLEEVFCINP